MKKRLVVLVSLILCICTAITAFSNEISSRDFSSEEAYAESLKQLGLFKGVSENNFDLEREPTRLEALVMLIRVLGEEQNALNGKWRHPFTDVPEWANAYVGYAYVNNLTNGISATQFGSGNANAATYLTFMLRALGYSDAGSADFSWDNPYDLAKSSGILTNSVDTDNFLRADTATISFNALAANLKDSADTLSDKLIEMGVFKYEQYIYEYNKNQHGMQPKVRTSLNAMQISEKCADAVFYIEIYSFNGKPRGSGSGFFISEDGLAVTNFHVANCTDYLIITLPDGRQFDNVFVVDGWFEQDLALLKVYSDTKFKYLRLGNSDELKQGQQLYVFGSPKGYNNTLSQGIVSNTQRIEGGTEYFQMTAPITNGSSGGPVVNEYGEVIGVSTAGYDVGSLNLAVPVNHIHALDRSSESGYILWGDICYPGFSKTLDFGSFTGVTVLSAEKTLFGYYIRYDAQDYHDIPSMDCQSVYRIADACRISSLFYYFKALERDGFKTEDIDSKTTLFTSEDENERLLFYYDPDEGKVFEILVDVKPQYYENAPKIPDAGWFFSLPNGTLETDFKSWTYSYKWNEYYNSTDFLYTLAEYFSWYKEDGFELINDGMRGENAVRDYKGKGYNVTCSYNETHLYIDIKET